MKEINQIFSAIKTPDSWKENLYGKIKEEKTVIRPKIKSLASVTAAAAAVLTVTITAAALTGLFDFGTIMKDSFDDDVSAAKIETGEYQNLDEYNENDLVSVEASAFMGDYIDSYIILEAKLKENAPKDFDRVSLTAKVYDETVTNPEEYAPDCYYGVMQIDENGDTVYIFKVRVYPHWSRHAVENNVSLLVDVTNICFETYEPATMSRRTADILLKFAPDESILKEFSSIEPNRKISVNGEVCTVERVISSDYATRVLIGYTVPDSLGEITDLWRLGCIYGETITGISNEEVKASYEACPFKFIVDGKELSLIGDEFNDMEKPFIITRITGEDGKSMTNNFLGVLRYEPFDFESAESVVIEIEGGETITVK